MIQLHFLVIVDYRAPANLYCESIDIQLTSGELSLIDLSENVTTSWPTLRLDPPWIEVSPAALGKLTVVTATAENQFGYSTSCKFVAKVIGELSFATVFVQL